MNMREAWVRKAFLVKTNGENQKDMSLSFNLPKFVEPQFSHLQNSVHSFTYFKAALSLR